MRRRLRRALIAFASAGWLVPLGLSFWAMYDFVWDVVWPTAAWGMPNKIAPFHLFEYADELFFVSLAWAAIAIVAWSLRLTR